MNNGLVAKLNLYFLACLASLLVGCRNIEIRLPSQNSNYEQRDYKGARGMPGDYLLIVPICDIYVKE